MSEAYGAELAEDKTRERSRERAQKQVRVECGQPEPQGVRRFPDKDRVNVGSEREASDHTGSSATRQ